MAQQFNCQYHEQEPATWQCSRCERLYCDQCVPRPPEPLSLGKCTYCSGDLVFQGAANKAEPFWHRIQQFFAYPFHTSALLFLGAITILGQLLVTGSFGFFLSLVLLLIYGAVFTKYLFRAIEECSYGHFEPPAVGEAFTGGGMELFFKQLGVFIIAGVVIIAVGKIGSLFLSILAIAVVALALPASIMILAQEQSLIEAINPGKISFVIRAIGWPYLILYAFLFLLYSGPAWLLSHVQGALYGPFLSLAGLLANGYFSLVMAAMMGYCLYQYQHRLGYTTDDEAACCPTPESYYKQLALAESHIFVKEGRLDEAIAVVRRTLNQGQAEDLELNERMHRLVLNGSDTGLLKKHSSHYLGLLLQKGQGYKAAQLFLNVRRKAPDFMPVDAKLRLELAQGLYGQGRHREAIALIKGFHKQFPNHPQIADAYLLGAKALSEGLGKDDQALRLLDFVLSNCPNAAIFNQVRQYKANLNKLITQQAGRNA